MVFSLRFFALTLVFCAAFYILFHIPNGLNRLDGYYMDASYPISIPIISHAIAPIFGEFDGLLLLLLLFAIFIPGLLIFHYWGWGAGAAYLFSAGGMVMLIDNTAIAQAFLQVFMIASLGNPLFYLPFAAFGQFIHREWFGGFVITLAFDLARRKDHGLIRLV